MRVVFALSLFLTAASVHGAESEGIEAFRSLFRSVTPKTSTAVERSRVSSTSIPALSGDGDDRAHGTCAPVAEVIDPAVAAQTVRWPDGEGSLDD